MPKQLGNIINNCFDVTAASEGCAVSRVLSVAKLFQFFPAAGDRDVVTGKGIKKKKEDAGSVRRQPMMVS